MSRNASSASANVSGARTTKSALRPRMLDTERQTLLCSLTTTPNTGQSASPMLWRTSEHTKAPRGPKLRQVIGSARRKESRFEETTRIRSGREMPTGERSRNLLAVAFHAGRYRAYLSNSEVFALAAPATSDCGFMLTTSCLWRAAEGTILQTCSCYARRATCKSMPKTRWHGVSPKASLFNRRVADSQAGM